MEHNLLRHPYLHHSSQVRSGYVFLTRYREAAEPLRRRRRRRAINYTNLHGGTHVRIFSYTFLKNFFGPFPMAPGLDAHIFESSS